jgi:hypothetical protein
VRFFIVLLGTQCNEPRVFEPENDRKNNRLPEPKSNNQRVISSEMPTLLRLGGSFGEAAGNLFRTALLAGMTMNAARVL